MREPYGALAQLRFAPSRNQARAGVDEIRDGPHHQGPVAAPCLITKVVNATGTYVISYDSQFCIGDPGRAPTCRFADAGVQLLFRSRRQDDGRCRLLVVDDDPAVREALALLLDLNGFDVDTAKDGRDAIRAIAVASPDAVILDVLMPGLDGIEVCRRILARSATIPRS